MSREEEIRREVLKTLEFLDKPEALPPDPYFYTRLKQRLQERERQAPGFVAVLRPALLILLILLNIGSAAWYLIGSSKTNQQVARQELISLLAEDFRTQSESTDILGLR